MSLRWRIAAGLGLIAAIVSISVGVAAYVSTARQLRDNVDDSLIARATALDQNPFGSERGELRDLPPRFVRPERCPPGGLLQPAVAAQVITTDGDVIVCIEQGSALPVDDSDLAVAGSDGSYRLHTVTIDSNEYRVITAPLGADGAIQLARGLDEVSDTLGSLRLRIGLITLAAVAAAVGLGWLLARRIVKPVERLRDTAETIARTQDLSVAIPAEGSDEIGSLGRSFTTMVDALSKSRADQQRLITDASHELRTPLTSLRTNAELLARSRELSPDEYEAVVDGLQLEVGELTALVSELVELANDSSANDEPSETLQLSDLAESVAARARRRSGRDVTVQEAGDDTVVARPQALERVIANLVDNAIKYSPEASPVEIALTGRRLEVRDRGPGILTEDRPHVFERFYRSTSARTELGSGLGLAIVKQTVARLGGTVWANDAPGGGAAVGFELPAPEG